MTGVWIGQTVDKTSALHLWLFVQSGERLTVYTRWLGHEEGQAIYEGIVPSGQSQFTLFADETRFIRVENDNFFAVPEWVMAEKGEELVPKYEVLFQKYNQGITGAFYALYIALFSWSPDLLRQLI